MNRLEKLNACKGQFVFPDFLDLYRLQLARLHGNPEFMAQVRKVLEQTAEPLLFGQEAAVSSAASVRFQAFKDNLCEHFYQTLPFSRFPDYRNIYYDVKNRNRAGKSATISVFYAMVYWDLINESPEPATFSVRNFLKNLLWPEDSKADPTIAAPGTATKSSSPAPKAPTARSSHALRTDFEAYLIRRGYSQHTPSGLPSTVYAYIKAIDTVCENELLDWAELSENIGQIVQKYDIGGSMEEQGDRGHRTVINALYRYREFCN